MATIILTIKDGQLRHTGITNIMPDFMQEADRKHMNQPSDAPYPTGYMVAKAQAIGLQTDLVTCQSTCGTLPKQFIALRP